jgi:hypothetical protein
LRLIIVVVQVGALKISSSKLWRRSGKKKHKMKPSLPPKLVGKLVSAYNAQGLRLIIVVVHVGALKISCSKQWRRSGKKKDKMKPSLPPKFVGKLV